MDLNNTTLLILVLLGALIVFGLIAGVVGRMQRSRKLQERFGPEYEHTVNEAGDKREGERELENRLDHVRKLDIRPLSVQEVDRLSSEWRVTQAQFVDEPLVALRKADELLSRAIQARGYPVEDFEQGVADISVDYPELAADYRGLHHIAVRGDREQVSTEEMRTAMVHGRALFERIVNNERTTENVNEKESI